MSDLRKAAQQALEALETPIHEQPLGLKQKAIADLRAALEQDEKPVAKIRTWHKGGEQNAELWDWDDGIETLPDGEHLLYASPPLRAALEQQAEPEPVAWSFEARHIDTAWGLAVSLKHPGQEHKYLRNVKPLYTAQPQRPPLTDDRLWELWNIDSDKAYENCPTYFQEFRYTARLVEWAHGIGEEK